MRSIRQSTTPPAIGEFLCCTRATRTRPAQTLSFRGFSGTTSRRGYVDLSMSTRRRAGSITLFLYKSSMAPHSNYRSTPQLRIKMKGAAGSWRAVRPSTPQAPIFS
eukprot:5803716-Pyramimonas_sp.AAC.1